MANQYKMGGTYQIRVIGSRDIKFWSVRLGGLLINQVDQDENDRHQVSTLTGFLCDQAELVGVLVTLYNNQYAILSVERLESEGNHRLQ